MPATVAKLRPDSTRCCAHTRMAVTIISRIATARLAPPPQATSALKKARRTVSFPSTAMKWVSDGLNFAKPSITGLESLIAPKNSISSG